MNGRLVSRRRGQRIAGFLFLVAAWFALPWFVTATGCAPQQSAASKIRREDAGAPSGPKPLALVEETEACLGILDLTEKIEKLFKISNYGDAPLKLSRGGTSCKCTMSTLPEEPIQPGETAVVRVSTKSEVTEGTFDHKATILTNDPEHPRITLRIFGKFEKVIAFDPPRLIVTGLNRETSTELNAVVYSQYFRDFDLTLIESSLDGLSWELEPAESWEIDRLEARCGYRMKLTIPPAQSPGKLWETLQVTARSDGDPPDVREVTLQIAGSTLPRAQMSGAKFGVDKVLRLGALLRREGAKERITLTMHDDHRNLKIEAIETEPDFLEVDVVPISPEMPDSGLYWVHVTVPKDAPPCNYLGKRMGEVRISTDHPALPVMSFSVHFAVGT